jgi:Holliday junction resolvase RusA-like endonuclease
VTQLALVREVLPAIEFKVAGAPLPQGSKFARIIGKGKSQRVILTDMADRKTKSRPSGALTAYKERIATKAAEVMSGDPWLGPVELECVFVIPRSPSHYTSKGALTSSAPIVPINDLDKLIRAVGDSLSKVVYRDDVQIISFGKSTKRFSETAAGKGGVFVKVRAL